MRYRLLASALALGVAATTAIASDRVSPDTAPPAAAIDPALSTAIAGDWRTPANVARDGFRNPGPTLTFFGVQADDTVIEITPGGGWYSEILAPYLRDGGRYVAAVMDPASLSNPRAATFYTGLNDGLRAKFAANSAQYGRAEVRPFSATAPVLGEAASADVLLTFRNVHNWTISGTEGAMFKAFFDVLKPGGVLGVVEHRAASDVPKDDRSGYLSEAQVIALATAAGFELAAKTEINANPRDDRDHPNGVWTLPPTLNVPEGEDKATYEAIGESDRMTLRFVKPAG